MIGYIKAAFDPITESAIQQIRNYQKENQLEEVVLIPTQNGIASLSDRIKMLKLATKRYRKMNVSIIEENDCIDFSQQFAEEESRVRNGLYYLASHGIQRYLIEYDIYLEQIVDACCNAHRAMHSKSVALLCKEIAHSHQLDEKLAWRMGMLHDITKKWDDESGRNLLAIYNPDKLTQNAKIWHSYTASIWIKQNIGITNPILLNAIYHHTLGDSDEPFAMILYIADKTDPFRGYDSSYEIELAKRDLKKGFNLVKEESKRYLLEKDGIHV